MNSTHSGGAYLGFRLGSQGPGGLVREVQASQPEGPDGTFHGGTNTRETVVVGCSVVGTRTSEVTDVSHFP
jgi:hypothetical protein